MGMEEEHNIISGIIAQGINIPIIVDSAKTYADFSMTRCNYLAIECDLPKSGWQVILDGEKLPFLMLELVGIIRQPFGAP